jgi:hypothetical protein
MSNEKPLYEDLEITISVYPRAPEAHLLVLHNQEYILLRGVLEEFAKTQKGGLEAKLNTLNPTLWAIIKESVGIQDLHIVLCQAYIEEQRRVMEDLKEENNRLIEQKEDLERRYYGSSISSKLE